MRPWLVALLGALVVVSGAFAAVGAAQSGGTGPGAASCSATAQDAQAAQQTATSRHEELRRLAAADGVHVPASVRDSVAYQVEQGDLALQTARYCAAQRHYRAATSQAEAALEQAYIARATLRLDAAAAHLRALEQRGYLSLRRTQLDERVATQRDRLETVDSYEAAKALDDDAAALSQEVRQLPTPWLVNAVRFVRSGVGIAVAILVVLGAGVTGAVIQRVRAPPSALDNEDYEEEFW
jgi:hypothetical protein